MNIKKIIPPFLIVFLGVLYALSFLPSLRGEKRSLSMETVLLNSHYSESLSELKISSRNSAIILEKKEGFWQGTAVSHNSAPDFSIGVEHDGGIESGGFEKEVSTAPNVLSTDYALVYTFPCDKGVIERAIENLQRIIKLYKVSDSKKQLSNFALDDEHAVYISYRTEEGVSGNFAVGKTDFSKRFRYIVFQNLEGIFKTDLDFQELLYTTARQWYDPYIVPRSLFQGGNEIASARITRNGSQSLYIPKDSENDGRLLELRHGSLGTWSDREIETTVLLEMAFGESLLLDFVRTDDDILVRAKAAHPDFEYCYHISEWTYKNILEIVL